MKDVEDCDVDDSDIVDVDIVDVDIVDIDIVDIDFDDRWWRLWWELVFSTFVMLMNKIWCSRLL